jgi:hypothetical protein
MDKEYLALSQAMISFSISASGFPLRPVQWLQARANIHQNGGNSSAAINAKAEKSIFESSLLSIGASPHAWTDFP